MQIRGRTLGFAAMLGIAGLVACSSGVDTSLPAPTPTLPPYTPPFEEEFSESLLIADITIEEVIELMGDPKSFEETFINRLPLLSVTPGSVFAILTAGEEFTESIAVTLDGPGPFEWDFMLSGEATWLDVFRPQEAEEGDFDQLVVHFDSAGRSPGRYEASVSVMGLPVARESPQIIRVVFEVLGEVLEPQAP